MDRRLNLFSINDGRFKRPASNNDNRQMRDENLPRFRVDIAKPKPCKSYSDTIGRKFTCNPNYTKQINIEDINILYTYPKYEYFFGHSTNSRNNIPNEKLKPNIHMYRNLPKKYNNKYKCCSTLSGSR